MRKKADKLTMTTLRSFKRTWVQEHTAALLICAAKKQKKICQPSVSPCVSGHVATILQFGLQPQGLRAHRRGRINMHSHTYSHTHSQHSSTWGDAKQAHIKDTSVSNACLMAQGGWQRLLVAPCSNTYSYEVPSLNGSKAWSWRDSCGGKDKV